MAYATRSPGSNQRTPPYETSSPDDSARTELVPKRLVDDMS
jgi:hypothetical protein